MLGNYGELLIDLIDRKNHDFLRDCFNFEKALFRWRVIVKHSVARKLPFWGLKLNQLQESSTNCRLGSTWVEESITHDGQKTFELLGKMSLEIASNARENKKQTFDLKEEKIYKMEIIVRLQSKLKSFKLSFLNLKA